MDIFHRLIVNRRQLDGRLPNYRIFLEWLTTKDKDFLRKFNKSALEVIPWSFDGAIKHILGNQYSIDGLWNQYQEFLTKQ